MTWTYFFLGMILFIGAFLLAYECLVVTPRFHNACEKAARAGHEEGLRMAWHIVHRRDEEARCRIGTEQHTEYLHELLTRAMESAPDAWVHNGLERLRTTVTDVQSKRDDEFGRTEPVLPAEPQPPARAKSPVADPDALYSLFGL